MLVVLAFCEKDWQAAIDLFKWCAELDGQYLQHKLVLVAARELSQVINNAVFQAAHKVFPKTEMVRPLKEDLRGWPASCNTMFVTGYDYVRLTKKCPYLWLEADSIPLRPGWLDELEFEYSKCGKPFMGCIYDNPYEHLTGVAVYPPNIEKFNPAIVNAGTECFDLVEAKRTIPHSHHTELYHHEWGDPDAWTFPNIKSLDRIKPEAVLFHRNKDGTLIQRLREKRNNSFKSLLDVIPAVKKRKKKDNRPLLQGVTIAAIDGTRTPRLTENSLYLSASRVKADKVLLLATTKPYGNHELYTECECEFRKIPPLTLDGYNKFCLTELYSHITTSHCLTIQADSSIVNPLSWNPEWLEYDYIGAPWPDGLTQTEWRVGNSGFCLRSRRLLQATAQFPTNEWVWRGKKYRGCRDDIVTCLMFRSRLEAIGFKFAPVEVAAKFSFEQPTKEAQRLNGQFGRHEWHANK